MSQVVFVRQHLTSRGRRHADMQVFSKQSFIDGVITPHRNLVRIAFVDGESMGVKSLTLKQFEEVFTREEIRAMQANGVLDFYPFIENNVEQKLPMFQASIYQKHGIPK